MSFQYRVGLTAFGYFAPIFFAVNYIVMSQPMWTPLHNTLNNTFHSCRFFCFTMCNIFCFVLYFSQSQGRLLMAVGITVYFLVAVPYLEEPDLIQEFGNKYRNYMKKTSMFFPIPSFRAPKKD